MTGRTNYQGHKARKRFGQNFLQDPWIIQQIVAAIAPQYQQTIVEIGPGLGALTIPLSQQNAKLILIELDRDLVTRLQAMPSLIDKVTIYQADALTFDFHQLTSNQKQLRLIGNLPYNISTPLIFHLFKFTKQIADMHFMLQKEVVNRLVAAPGSKTYGKLTVMAQYFYHIESVLDVPSDAFKPTPKVNSAVVRLIPRHKPELACSSVDRLYQLCNQVFQQRRKILRNILQDQLTSQDFNQLNIDDGDRPESLTVAQFVTITNYLMANKLM